MADETHSPDGSPVHRYSNPWRELEPASDLQDFTADIAQHLEEFLGPPDNVFFEIVPDIVPINILQYRPTPKRKLWTFVSSGASSLPMAVPKGVSNPKDFERIELLIALPEDWLPRGSAGLGDKESFRSPEKWWPIEKLKEFARFPHRYGAWIWKGHTLSNGDPPEALGAGTKQTGFILLPPTTLPRQACAIETEAGVPIALLALVPLYSEEMNLKLGRGDSPLRRLLEQAGVNEIVAPKRRNVALQN
jgi:hypothetical protein